MIDVEAGKNFDPFLRAVIAERATGILRKNSIVTFEGLDDEPDFIGDSGIKPPSSGPEGIARDHPIDPQQVGDLAVAHA